MSVIATYILYTEVNMSHIGRKDILTGMLDANLVAFQVWKSFLYTTFRV